MIERIRAMLARRHDPPRAPDADGDQPRHGALVAWQVPEEKLNAAFDYMFQQDPFSGHVVIRSTDQQTTGGRSTASGRR